MNICNNKITYNTVRDIRKKAFEKIEKLPFSYLDSHRTGDIVSRVIGDADQFSDGILMGFSQFFTGAVTIIGTLCFMISINAWIALTVVVITPLSLFIARFIAKKTYDKFLLQSKTRGEQTAFINEMVENQKVVQSFSRESKTLADFDKINERLSKNSIKAIFYSSITNPATRFVNSIVYAAVAFIGAMCVINGTLSVGFLVTFLSYANQYTKPFNEISGVIVELQNAFACAQRLFEFIEEEEITPDNESPIVNPNAVKGNIEFKNVCFSYVEDKPLISDFNLNVKSGMNVAIVGPTGCGKTTLINLLMRFYEIDAGEITLDGISTKQMSRKALRRSFGMVLQETWLKNGTIRENIAMGKPDASDDEIIAAAKAVKSHSFIKTLPQGYDTIIDENGGMLSQGQKQLLCITRIMLSRPPMLILDEATSSIDARTEMIIQNAFNKLMQGRTSFIVAHRLSTIRNADLFLVMNNGSVVEQGTHSELLEKRGFYNDLYNSQFAD